MEKLCIHIISKTPPGGRCEIYNRYLFEVVKAYENVYYCLIPSSLYEGKITPPAILVNGKILEPEDGILLTPQEIVDALESRGAIVRKGVEDLKKKLESIYEKFIEG